MIICLRYLDLDSVEARSGQACGPFRLSDYSRFDWFLPSLPKGKQGVLGMIIITKQTLSKSSTSNIFKSKPNVILTKMPDDSLGRIDYYSNVQMGATYQGRMTGYQVESLATQWYDPPESEWAKATRHLPARPDLRSKIILAFSLDDARLTPEAWNWSYPALPE